MKKFLSLLAAVSLLTSCSDEAYIEMPPDETSSGSGSVSLEQALQKADDFFGKVYDENTRSVRIVKSVEEISTSNGLRTRSYDGNPDYYIINYADDGGFAVVSAKEEMDGIYAISDEGELHMADTVNNAGLACFFAMLPQSTAGTGYIPVPTIPKDSLPHDFVVIPGPISHCSKQEPLLTKAVRQWHQYPPFNHYAPLAGNGTDNCLAGCVPVAAGMLMSFHEVPKSYNGHAYQWDRMKTDISNSTVIYYGTARLLADLGNSKNFNTDYGKDSSGSYMKQYYKRTFQNFGYQKPKDFVSFNPTEAYNRLAITKRPLLMQGKSNSGAHGWVCDGYYLDSYEYQYAGQSTYSGEGAFLHMTWGWLNNCNGYFKFGETVIPHTEYNVEGDQYEWNSYYKSRVQYYDIEYVDDIAPK